MSSSPPIEQLISRELHNLLYLEEFVFPSSKFTPRDKSEVELADAVVALNETLLIFQIKERDLRYAGDESAERAWFQKKILKSATKQIRDTIEYLASATEIPVANSRGRVFDIASQVYDSTVKIVIYKAAQSLPSDCRAIRFHRSRTAGFIHILEFDDYVRLSEFLRVPEEIRLYFAYRERMLTEHQAQCRSLPEASFAGAFVDNDAIPSPQSYRQLHAVIDDEESWDLIPLLRGLHDHQSREEYSDDYYRILSTFMRMPRSIWREIKKRFILGVEMATADEFALPYRVTDPVRSIGVVIVPVDSKISGKPDWEDVKVKMLITLTQLHKFDHKSDTCIGIIIAKFGRVFDIQWCMIEDPWTENPELRARLDTDSPFREASEKRMFGFFSAN